MESSRWAAGGRRVDDRASTQDAAQADANRSGSPVASVATPTQRLRGGPRTEPRSLVRIVLALDEGLFGDAVAEVLRAQPDLDVVGITRGDGELVAEARTRGADLALVDASLAARIGPVNRLVGEFARGLPILLVNQPAQPVAVGALVPGLRGYLTCDASVTELIAAVHAVARGEIVVPASAANAGLAKLVAAAERHRP